MRRNEKTNKPRRNKVRTKRTGRVINEYIDYKDSKQLEKFVNDQGKIIPRRITGLSAKQHRELVRAIKRARQIAILPFVSEAVK